eukprot:NODE_2633_length_2175_cov_5.516113.p1 GENE.NODE_2633_length_2175_cov_5.516113~~NODE_2633_length_2175_cov_5.516113.p1  ORF type:complete len:701 (+),score=177.13 NODE_2633_length_2175_cov_5.516113:114-2105(+)
MVAATSLSSARHGGATACDAFDPSAPTGTGTVYVNLARAKMARAAREAAGMRSTLAEVECELALLGHAMTACGSGDAGGSAGGDGGSVTGTLAADALAVLAEFWEEADEASLALVDEEQDQDTPPVPEEEDLPGADSESLAAVARLVAQMANTPEWPPDKDCGTMPTQPLRTIRASAPARCVPHAGAAGQSGPLHQVPPTGPLQPQSAPQSLPSAAPKSSFRTAADLLPPAPSRPPASSRSEPVNFDAVSRSIVGRSGSGASSSPRAKRREKRPAEGAPEREWSEEWLRIADPEQLERIVPALEATIRRPDAGGALKRADITGLEFVKAQIEEVLILPRLHPQLFASALTKPGRGLLLFGPPGTGKTMLARWIAAECGSTFFNINASSVLSKWVGEAEKTVKALFQLASDRQPSVIFIDEIDSLLSRRRDADNESSRRVKNEFLTSLEGAETAAEEKLLLIGATNMPWELDPAALRRLPKRLYVPLPGRAARRTLLSRQLESHNAASGLSGALTAAGLDAIVDRTPNFSGSDMQSLLREAAMGPVRDARAALGRLGTARGAAAGGAAAAPSTSISRDIIMRDFEAALRRVRPSFSEEEANKHRAFNEEHGTCRGERSMCDDDDDDDDGEGTTATMAATVAMEATDGMTGTTKAVDVARFSRPW